MKTIILDSTRISRIIKRIAFQVIESCYEEESITMIGIEPRGNWVAEKLQTELQSLSSLQIKLISVEANRALSPIAENIEHKCVVLVDDILNSGHTMMKVASNITLLNPSKLITACLVDRKHRRFPVHSDFTGLSLATTIQEHLTLDIENGPMIYLD